MYPKKKKKKRRKKEKTIAGQKKYMLPAVRSNLPTNNQNINTEQSVYPAYPVSNTDIFSSFFPDVNSSAVNQTFEMMFDLSNIFEVFAKQFAQIANRTPIQTNIQIQLRDGSILSAIIPNTGSYYSQIQYVQAVLNQYAPWATLHDVIQVNMVAAPQTLKIEQVTYKSFSWGL